ncbi:hypothetical protein FSP39_016340 [Pinctada imbricata]|uniref:Very long-chain fatty acid transport protein n=1 Tax=Pinctada imbricata TaxID=66713 RepID=A0AA88XPP7_PINIB|nr:hypothetical protein FSP39_016340 [Pinctada imbricata]
MSSILKWSVLLSLWAMLAFYLGFSLMLSTLVVLGLYLATGGYKFAWIVINTLPRDLKALKVLITLKLKTRQYIKDGTTIPKLFTKTAKKYPNKDCILFEKERWTFQEVESYTNKIANYFTELGYKKGDVVAVFMENRPEYICLWLGLSKIGVVAALVNYNLRNQALEHSIKAADARAIIFSSELQGAVTEILSSIPRNVRHFCLGSVVANNFMATHLNSCLERAADYPPPTVKVGFTEKLFYVYTSGTTGLPKAAIISHSRFHYMASAVRQFLNITSADVLYDCLPLYHTAGGVVGAGQMILGGTTLVIRKKFSASRFWDDCIEYGCTAGQYIGEICRYLLAQPIRPNENKHKVRVMFGNGLKPQIWPEFQKRFGVQQMGEFYGATEGNCNTINPDNTVGAVGFTTRLVPSLYPITLIKVDERTGEHIRDRQGVCIKAKPGEAGELVGRIVKGDALREFDGYVSRQATDKKVCHNVFKDGDTAFLTGDILVMDDFGYFYFRDRTGDTFRWKGENVSTSEVEAVISNIVKLNDAVVYGVEVPGAEGRAGMAAIVDENDNLDLRNLTTQLQQSLPPYARPLFLRLMKEVDTTGTFKLKKVDLRKEGYNPSQVKDRLYFYDSKALQYSPITPAAYSDICSGKIRF